MANGQKKPRRVPSKHELRYKATLALGGAILRAQGDKAKKPQQEKPREEDSGGAGSQ